MMRRVYKIFILLALVFGAAMHVQADSKRYRKRYKRALFWGQDDLSESVVQAAKKVKSWVSNEFSDSPQLLEIHELNVKVSAQRLKLEASELENARLKARVRGLEIQASRDKLKLEDLSPPARSQAGSKKGKKFDDKKKTGRKTGGKTEKGKKFLEQRVEELERENSALQTDMQRRDVAGSIRTAVVELAARVCEDKLAAVTHARDVKADELAKVQNAFHDMARVVETILKPELEQFRKSTTSSSFSSSCLPTVEFRGQAWQPWMTHDVRALQRELECIRHELLTCAWQTCSSSTPPARVEKFEKERQECKEYEEAPNATFASFLPPRAGDHRKIGKSGPEFKNNLACWLLSLGLTLFCLWVYMEILFPDHRKGAWMNPSDAAQVASPECECEEQREEHDAHEIPPRRDDSDAPAQVSEGLAKSPEVYDVQNELAQCIRALQRELECISRELPTCGTALAHESSTSTPECSETACPPPSSPSPSASVAPGSSPWSPLALFLSAFGDMSDDSVLTFQQVRPTLERAGFTSQQCDDILHEILEGSDVAGSEEATAAVGSQGPRDAAAKKGITRSTSEKALRALFPDWDALWDTRDCTSPTSPSDAPSDMEGLELSENDTTTATSEKESAVKDAGQPRHYLQGFPHGNFLQHSHLFEPSSPPPQSVTPPLLRSTPQATKSWRGAWRVC